MTEQFYPSWRNHHGYDQAHYELDEQQTTTTPDADTAGEDSAPEPATEPLPTSDVHQWERQRPRIPVVLSIIPRDTWPVLHAPYTAYVAPQRL